MQQKALPKSLKTESYSYTTIKNKTKDFSSSSLKEKLMHPITVKNVGGVINLDDFSF